MKDRENRVEDQIVICPGCLKILTSRVWIFDPFRLLRAYFTGERIMEEECGECPKPTELPVQIPLFRYSPPQAEAFRPLKKSLGLF